MNDNIQVRITGDASGVAPAIDVAKGSIAGLGAAVEGVTAMMGGFAASMRAGFATVSTAANDAAAVVTGAGERMSIAGESVKAHWEGLSGVMGKFSGLATGALAVLGGGALFEKAVEATVKLTSENLRLSRALGITTEKASGVHSALEKLGIASDVIVGATQRMTRQLKAHEDAFNKLGIATRDANGHFRDSLDIMTSGLDVLGTLRAGVDRTAASQVMFGRGAGDLTQLMRLNNKEIEEGARVAKELGLVTTEQGVTAMYKYKDSVREVHEVMEGFKVQVGNALLPVLTKLAEWFRGNGAAAINGFVERLTALVDGIRRIVIAFEAIGAELNVFRAMLNGINECVDSFKEQLVVDFETIGKVVVDALTLHWGAIQGDWEAGMAKIDAIASSHLTHIAGEAKRTQDAVAELSRAFDNVGKVDPNQDQGTPTSLAGIMAAGYHSDGIGGARTDDISGKKPKKEKTKKEPKAKDDLVQQLDAELEAKKTAWAMAQDAQGTFQQYSLKSEADYWAAAKDRTDLSAKDKTAIEGKYLAARKALKTEEIADQLDKYKQEYEAAKSNWALKVKIAQAAEAEIIRLYGAESKEARNAAAAVRKALDEQAKAEKAYQVEVSKGIEDLQLAKIAAAQETARFTEQAGAESKGALIAQEKQFEQQIYAIKKEALDRQVALQKELDPNDKTKLQALYNQGAQLYGAYQTKLLQLDRQAMAQRNQVWTSFTSTFSSSLAKMVTLQQGFAATFKSIWQGIQTAVAGILQQMIAQFVTKQMIKIGLIKAEHAATVQSEASLAGAGGVASMAAAPFPLNLTAPAFGASMSAAAMAFGAPGYDVGAWNLSKDHLAMVHSGEMIIPANIAAPMRAGLTQAANNNSPGAGGGGDTHNHFEAHFHGPANKAQVNAWLKDHAQGVGGAVRHYVRQGGNVSPNRH